MNKPAHRAQLIWSRIETDIVNEPAHRVGDQLPASVLNVKFGQELRQLEQIIVSEPAHRVGDQFSASALNVKFG